MGVFGFLGAIVVGAVIAVGAYHVVRWLTGASSQKEEEESE